MDAHSSSTISSTTRLEQSRLAAEVIARRRLVDAGLRGDGLERERREPLLRQESLRGLQDARGGGIQGLDRRIHDDERSADSHETTLHDGTGVAVGLAGFIRSDDSEASVAQPSRRRQARRRRSRDDRGERWRQRRRLRPPRRARERRSTTSSRLHPGGHGRRDASHAQALEDGQHEVGGRLGHQQDDQAGERPSGTPSTRESAGQHAELQHEQAAERLRHHRLRRDHTGLAAEHEIPEVREARA